MRLNMGSGLNKRAGYVNVDASPASNPDQLWDLENTPWPWPTSSAEEVLFNHSLEHMGADTKTFLAIMTELYRICAPGAAVLINVPHPRHDHFLGDPTHVRAILPETLKLFDRARNDAWIAAGNANTPLAIYTGVDFEFVSMKIILEQDIFEQLQSGKISQAEVGRMVARDNNVAKEFQFVIRARKASTA